MHILTFKHFSKFSEINHGITTRKGGISPSVYSSLNLSYSVADSYENVKKNRQLLSEYFGLKHANLIFPNQCHSSNICVISKRNYGMIILDNTDALICSDENIAIGVLAADCYPLLFFDRVNKVIAAAHAGWRGTVNEICRKVISKLKSDFNSSAENIYVGIGPGISQNQYEVDEKVVREIKKLDVELEMVLQQSNNDGHFLLNLAELNKLLILTEGIPEDHIELMNLCTYNNPNLFFSARRDGFETGRTAAVIKLNHV
jgi:YfiH family protein